MLIQNNGVDSLLYAYSDFQGSLIALTDASGNVVEKYAYDPWGARRNPDDWTQKDSRNKWITNRGYTMHEHLDAFGIINMNGRVYDPLTAQFFSPDPLVQAPDNWTNYNRYGYCLNNPLIYSDPSGYTFDAKSQSGYEEQFWQYLGGGGGYAQGYYATTGGGGGGGYKYLGGTYFNSNGEPVPFSEVYDNYISRNLDTSNNANDKISGFMSYMNLFAFNNSQFKNPNEIGINWESPFINSEGEKVYETVYLLDCPIIVPGLSSVKDNSGLNALSPKYDPNSLIGPDGCVNLYTPNEEKTVFKFMLAIGTGGLAIETGTAAALGEVAMIGLEKVGVISLAQFGGGFVEGTIKSFFGPDPETSSSIFMNPASDFGLNVSEGIWNTATISGKNPLPSYP